MRIVITGGCGFLGRRLALSLLERGSGLGPIDELVLFDNAPSALPLPDDKRIRLATGDIADRETVRQLLAARRRGGVSPRRGGQRPGRGRHRSRLSGQSRRHPRGARRLPGARNLPAPGFRQFARGLWRRAAAGGRRRHAADPADFLRHAKGDRRTAGQRLQPQGVCRRPRAAPADRGRAPGPAEPRRLDLCLLDHPRAAGREGCGVPGLARCGHGLGLAPPGRRGAPSRARTARRRLRRQPIITAAGLLGRGRRDGRRRCAALAARRPMPGSAGSPTRRSNRSSPAGRRRWPRAAPKRSASLPMLASTRPSRLLSRTISRRSGS